MEELCGKGILLKVGTTGKGTHYVFNRKRTINAPNTP